jgi:hypothetical protein
MTVFLPAVGGQGNDTESPSVEIVACKPATHPTISLDKLLATIQMKEVQVPANGSCWK